MQRIEVTDRGTLVAVLSPPSPAASALARLLAAGHHASALLLRDDLTANDVRLPDAAQDAGLVIVSPGR